MKLTVSELAKKLDAPCEGETTVSISGVSGLREAQPGDISFLSQPRYASYMQRTGASAVVVAPGFDGEFRGALVRVEDPEAAIQRIAGWFAPPAVSQSPGIHCRAILSEGVVLGDDVGVGPNAVLEEGVQLGDGSRVGAGCFLGRGVQIGSHCIVYPLVTIREHCVIGDRTLIHSGTVIGSDGFGFAVDDEGVRRKIPQIGIVEIGDDVEIGANVTIDRARFGKTRIGNDVKIDNLVHVAHNVVLKDGVVLVAQVGIAGSTLVEARAILGGQVGVGGHLVVGEGASAGGQAGITKDVEAGTYVTGYPAMPHTKAARSQALVNRLPHLKKKVGELEHRVRELETQLGTR